MVCSFASPHYPVQGINMESKHSLLAVGFVAWAISAIAFFLIQSGYVVVGKIIIFLCVGVIFYVVIKGQINFFKKLRPHNKEKE